MLADAPGRTTRREELKIRASFTLTVYAKALPEQQLEAAAKMDALFGT